LNKQISIIGCGWLGFPLAKHLIKHKFTIKGSTRSLEKLEILRAEDISPYFVSFENNEIQGELENCLDQSDTLILNIPPSLRHSPTHDFTKHIELLIPFIEDARIKQVLFISSTSVYADSEKIPVITEKSDVNPQSKSGIQLLKAEQLLQNNSNFHTTILRFSGLFGNDRHPAKYLSGKTNIKNPTAPVNLIHLNDCIRIIQLIIEHGIWNETFNVATTSHPLRKDYYTSVCKDLKLAVPKFNVKDSSTGKLINSEKLVRILDYAFKVKL